MPPAEPLATTPDALLTSAHRLLTCTQMGAADAWAMRHGEPGEVLMARAGQAVADAICARWAPRPVLVACGPGNNGGDGLVVARLLAERGWPVQVACLTPLAAYNGDAAVHAARLLARPGGLPPVAVPVRPLAECDPTQAGLLVDALFGAGLTRPLDAPVQAWLATASQAGVPIVAVDVPSGIHGDTGANHGAAQADLTITFFRKKPGHLLMPGRALCGEVWVRDIGIAPAALADDSVCHAWASLQAWENVPALWQRTWPHPANRAASVVTQAPHVPQALHKYQRGHALVFGGAVMVGAARLSARAAARVGAGLTTLLVPESVWPAYAAGQLCGMVQALSASTPAGLHAHWAQQLAQLRWHSLVLGPGAALGLPAAQPMGGTTVPVGVSDANLATLRELVLAALAASNPERGVVLDADAITAFASHPQALFDAIQHPTVLTPHEGEFVRLFGAPVAGNGHSKIEQTLAAARASGAVVLHKGPDTVVASPDGRVVVNSNAPAWLATAGSGDVLSGLIGGLLAQGVPAFEAACAGAWLHGQAARVFGPGLLADDLPEQLPAVLRQLWPA